MESRMMPPPQASARQTEMGETFNRVLFAALDALQERSIPYGLIGGVAASGHGRPRSTHDIDIFIRPEDAEATLAALDAAGFETERFDPRWLYKGWKDKMMVDIIFKSQGDIYFDDEMHRRLKLIPYHGRNIAAVSPEDMIVIKCAVHSEVGPHHWHDALAILSHAELDWDYLLSRARRATRRVLALLIYAQSNDIWIPNNVIETLFKNIFQNQPVPSKSQETNPISAETSKNSWASPLFDRLANRLQNQPQMGKQPLSHAEAHLTHPLVIHHHERTEHCPEYTKSHLYEALASDQRTAHLNCEIIIDSGERHRISVSGDAPSDFHRRAIEQVIHDYAPGFSIDNQVRIFEMTSEECAPVVENLQ